MATRLTETPDVEKYYGGEMNRREGNTLFVLIFIQKHLVCYTSTIFVLNVHPDVDKKFTKFPGQCPVKDRPYKPSVATLMGPLSLLRASTSVSLLNKPLWLCSLTVVHKIHSWTL